MYLFSTVIILIICVLIATISYQNGTYFKSTHRSFFSVHFDKGAFGEYNIYMYLRGYEANGAKLLFNCYLPKNNNETSEIDVIMIYRSGIYVFESKDYGGWIFGSESNKTWTQTLPNGKTSQKLKFYNPIMQNRTHIKWLEKHVDNTVPLHNIVVFSNRCELKKLEITSGDVSVIKLEKLLKTIKDIDERVGPRLDDDRISAIYEKLYPYTQVSAELKEKHVDNIKHNNQIKSDIVHLELFLPPKTDNDDFVDICPLCGGDLVLRTSKNGPTKGNKFYGCSSYPDCKYIRNIDD